MEVHICNLNTLDAEAGESGVQGHFEQLRRDHVSKKKCGYLINVEKLQKKVKPKYQKIKLISEIIQETI